MYDNVNNPKHYQLPHGGESVDVIREVLTFEEFDGWCKGNILKYIARYKEKGGVESLKKARVYLNWLIDSVEKSNKTDEDTKESKVDSKFIAYDKALWDNWDKLKSEFDFYVKQPQGSEEKHKVEEEIKKEIEEYNNNREIAESQFLATFKHHYGYKKRILMHGETLEEVIENSKEYAKKEGLEFLGVESTNKVTPLYELPGGK